MTGFIRNNIYDDRNLNFEGAPGIQQKKINVLEDRMQLEVGNKLLPYLPACLMKNAVEKLLNQPLHIYLPLVNLSFTITSKELLSKLLEFKTSEIVDISLSAETVARCLPFSYLQSVLSISMNEFTRISRKWKAAPFYFQVHIRFLNSADIYVYTLKHQICEIMSKQFQLTPTQKQTTLAFLHSSQFERNYENVDERSALSYYLMKEFGFNASFVTPPKAANPHSVFSLGMGEGSTLRIFASEINSKEFFNLYDSLAVSILPFLKESSCSMDKIALQPTSLIKADLDFLSLKHAICGIAHPARDDFAIDQNSWGEHLFSSVKGDISIDDKREKLSLNYLLSMPQTNVVALSQAIVRTIHSKNKNDFQTNFFISLRACLSLRTYGKFSSEELQAFLRMLQPYWGNCSTPKELILLIQEEPSFEIVYDMLLLISQSPNKGLNIKGRLLQMEDPNPIERILKRTPFLIGSKSFRETPTCLEALKAFLNHYQCHEAFFGEDFFRSLMSMECRDRIQLLIAFLKDSMSFNYILERWLNLRHMKVLNGDLDWILLTLSSDPRILKAMQIPLEHPTIVFRELFQFHLTDRLLDSALIQATCKENSDLILKYLGFISFHRSYFNLKAIRNAWIVLAENLPLEIAIKALIDASDLKAIDKNNCEDYETCFSTLLNRCLDIKISAANREEVIKFLALIEVFPLNNLKELCLRLHQSIALSFVKEGENIPGKNQGALETPLAEPVLDQLFIDFVFEVDELVQNGAKTSLQEALNLLLNLNLQKRFKDRHQFYKLYFKIILKLVELDSSNTLILSTVKLLVNEIQETNCQQISEFFKNLLKKKFSLVKQVGSIIFTNLNVFQEYSGAHFYDDILNLVYESEVEMSDQKAILKILSFRLKQKLNDITEFQRILKMLEIYRESSLEEVILKDIIDHSFKFELWPDAWKWISRADFQQISTSQYQSWLKITPKHIVRTCLENHPELALKVLFYSQDLNSQSFVYSLIQKTLERGILSPLETLKIMILNRVQDPLLWFQALHVLAKATNSGINEHSYSSEDLEFTFQMRERSQFLFIQHGVQEEQLDGDRVLIRMCKDFPSMNHKGLELLLKCYRPRASTLYISVLDDVLEQVVKNLNSYENVFNVRELVLSLLGINQRAIMPLDLSLWSKIQEKINVIISKLVKLPEAKSTLFRALFSHPNLLLLTDEQQCAEHLTQLLGKHVGYEESDIDFFSYLLSREWNSKLSTNAFRKLLAQEFINDIKFIKQFKPEAACEILYLILKKGAFPHSRNKFSEYFFENIMVPIIQNNAIERELLLKLTFLINEFKPYFVLNKGINSQWKILSPKIVELLFLNKCNSEGRIFLDKLIPSAYENFKKPKVLDAWFSLLKFLLLNRHLNYRDCLHALIKLNGANEFRNVAVDIIQKAIRQTDEESLQLSLKVFKLYKLPGNIGKLLLQKFLELNLISGEGIKIIEAFKHLPSEEQFVFIQEMLAYFGRNQNQSFPIHSCMMQVNKLLKSSVPLPPLIEFQQSLIEVCLNQHKRGILIEISDWELLVDCLKRLQKEFSVGELFDPTVELIEKLIEIDNSKFIFDCFLLFMPYVSAKRAFAEKPLRVANVLFIQLGLIKDYKSNMENDKAVNFLIHFCQSPNSFQLTQAQMEDFIETLMGNITCKEEDISFIQKVFSNIRHPKIEKLVRKGVLANYAIGILNRCLNRLLNGMESNQERYFSLFCTHLLYPHLEYVLAYGFDPENDVFVSNFISFIVSFSLKNQNINYLFEQAEQFRVAVKRSLENQASEKRTYILENTRFEIVKKIGDSLSPSTVPFLEEAIHELNILAESELEFIKYEEYALKILRLYFLNEPLTTSEAQKFVSRCKELKEELHFTSRSLLLMEFYVSPSKIEFLAKIDSEQEKVQLLSEVMKNISPNSLLSSKRYCEVFLLYLQANIQIDKSTLSNYLRIGMEGLAKWRQTPADDVLVIEFVRDFDEDFTKCVFSRENKIRIELYNEFFSFLPILSKPHDSLTYKEKMRKLFSCTITTFKNILCLKDALSLTNEKEEFIKSVLIPVYKKMGAISSWHVVVAQTELAEKPTPITKELAKDIYEEVQKFLKEDRADVLKVFSALCGITTVPANQKIKVGHKQKLIPLNLFNGFVEYELRMKNLDQTHNEKKDS